jgi:hypothetical protein
VAPWLGTVCAASRTARTLSRAPDTANSTAEPDTPARPGAAHGVSNRFNHELTCADAAIGDGA